MLAAPSTSKCAPCAAGKSPVKRDAWAGRVHEDVDQARV
jgi:hypothetical protein